MPSVPPAPGGAPGGAGTGGATAPVPMLGGQAKAMEQVHVGLKALTQALSELPIGSELSNEIMSAVGKIGKHLPQGGQGGDPQGAVQQLAMMARQAKAEPGQANALQGLMGGGGAPPPPGAGAPPPGAPPMGA